MKILHIDSSINGNNSVSRILSSATIDQLKKRYPAAEIVRRDLGLEPLPHFTLDAFSDQSIVDEFLAADTVVIGAPMYNFGVASQLKAWMDRIAIAGKTFRYTEQGPVGLAGTKLVIIASSRGGFFGPGSPTASLDHQETYLRTFFEFLGVTNIHFIRAEGIAMGPEIREKAIKEAQSEVLKFAA